MASAIAIYGVIFLPYLNGLSFYCLTIYYVYRPHLVVIYFSITLCLYIEVRSKAHRNQVNAKVNKEVEKEKDKYKNIAMPFDMKRMAYVDLGPLSRDSLCVGALR